MNLLKFLKKYAPEIFVFSLFLFGIATHAKGTIIVFDILVLTAMIAARILKKEH